MYNQMTDQYKIVQTEIVKVLPIFGQMISAENNYSLVVFWCGEYIGSKPARNAPPRSMSGHKPIKKVKNGNIIYWVSSANYPVSIGGQCTTKDHYIRIYEMTLDLMVVNPVLFAQGYRLGKDPLKMAVEAARSEFLDYVTQTKHDFLQDWLPDSKFNERLAKETGMKVTISRQAIRVDPKHVQPVAPGLEADINDLEMLREDIQKFKEELKTIRDEQETIRLEDDKMYRRQDRQIEIERNREISRQKHISTLENLKRKEEEAEHIHQLHSQLLETAAQELAYILKARIQDIYESNRPIDEVVKVSDDFMKALHESLLKVIKEDETHSSGSSANTNGTSQKALYINAGTLPLPTPPLPPSLSPPAGSFHPQLSENFKQYEKHLTDEIAGGKPNRAIEDPDLELPILYRLAQIQIDTLKVETFVSKNLAAYQRYESRFLSSPHNALHAYYACRHCFAVRYGQRALGLPPEKILSWLEPLQQLLSQVQYPDLKQLVEENM